MEKQEMIIDQYKREEQKKKGGRIKQPPFIVYVCQEMLAQPDKP